MKSFKEFITESKNTHLEHIESAVLNGGIDGTRQAIDFLRGLRDMLAGHSDARVNVTTKWDGAPAIFAGIDPETKKFFVGTKGVFNKEPKLNFTNDDINKNHPSAGLNKKLKVALAELSKLSIKGVIQGDMLFTKEDLKTQTIDGEKYITFQPNTIVYAIPAKSALAREIKAAKMGIVWHTSYKGRRIQDMKASFNINVSKLGKSRSVWYRDATFKDESGNATMTSQETENLTAHLSAMGSLFSKMDSSIVNMISGDKEILALIKQFNNTKVREGSFIVNVRKHILELEKWIKAKYEAEAEKLKRPESKENKRSKAKLLLDVLQSNRDQLIVIFEMQKLIIEAKNIILEKLERVKGMGTFVQTSNGFQSTAPEGFVAVDRLSGDALKIVDRLEFSRQNFLATKNWSK